MTSPTRQKPVTYRAEFAGRAYDYCLGSYTDAQLAAEFGVTARTVVRWRKEHPAFRKSCVAGRRELATKRRRDLLEREFGMRTAGVKVTEDSLTIKRCGNRADTPKKKERWRELQRLRSEDAQPPALPLTATEVVSVRHIPVPVSRDRPKRYTMAWLVAQPDFDPNARPCALSRSTSFLFDLLPPQVIREALLQYLNTHSTNGDPS